MESFSEDYVTVANTTSPDQAELWSLVLLSAGIANITQYQDHNYLVMVEESQAEWATNEIDRYESENLNWPPQKHIPSSELTGAGKRPPTVLLMGGLLVFYQMTGPYSAGNPWFLRGAVDSGAILEKGEWWRLITALTLHADPVHLLGNLLIGGIVIHYLCRTFGTGLGWFLVLLAGSLANFANVAARGPGHISVGFSTAVFAAVGLLSGVQLRFRNLRSILLPLGAGVSLLAMLGSSGERTDLGAHLWGLTIGLLMGMVSARLGKLLRSRSSSTRQVVLLSAALMIVWFAWLKALAV